MQDIEYYHFSIFIPNISAQLAPNVSISLVFLLLLALNLDRLKF